MIVISGRFTRVHHGGEEMVEALQTVSQSVLVLLSSVLPPSLYLKFTVKKVYKFTSNANGHFEVSNDSKRNIQK